MPTQKNLPAFLSTEEAARLLKVHTNTIVRWIKIGALPSSRIGREYRIPKEAIENRVTRISLGTRVIAIAKRRSCQNNLYFKYGCRPSTSRQACFNS